MASVCLYFHVHQPRRIRSMRVVDIGRNLPYFLDGEGNLNNKEILAKVARKCYLPANAVLLELLNKYPEFHVSFSITGVLLEQLEEHLPEVLDSFKKLVDTGRVEIVGETYYHSLAFIHSKSEFQSQIKLHQKKIKEVFGITPKIFRNTELIYNNEIAAEIAELGFRGILIEGVDRILGWRSPNFVYATSAEKSLPLLLKNYRLSDDIAFRFSSKDWSEYPLTADKFAHWVSQVNGNGQLVNLFMDYETLGEHQWEDTGIFEFLRSMPGEIYKHPDNDFITPSQAIKRYQPVGTLDIPEYISWADVERDLSAWLENSMQQESLKQLYELESEVLATKDAALINDWRLMQTSDHFYYMCTKWFADGDVHKYFSPYESPYLAFLSYMNTLHDLRLRVDSRSRRSRPSSKSSVSKSVPQPRKSRTPRGSSAQHLA